MKKLIAILSFAIFATTLFSQSYMTAGGVRLGTDWGLTIQQRVAKSGTIEGILQSSLQRNEVMVTALYEHHYPMVIKKSTIEELKTNPIDCSKLRELRTFRRIEILAIR